MCIFTQRMRNSLLHCIITDALSYYAPITQFKYLYKMDTKKKKEYAAPTTDVVELRTEGQLLQMSGGDFPEWFDGGDLF